MERPQCPTVALLAYDGMELFELGCAVELFGVVRPGLEESWYRLKICGEHSGQIATNCGLGLVPPHGLQALGKADTIIIPNWPIERRVPETIANQVRMAWTRGARIASICSGAFLLAELGLLAGRRATTHWLFADELTRRYPNVLVQPGVLYVDEGQIITSAGAAAGIDMMLHLVRKDFGASVCNFVARRMVVPPHRDGGQAQFIVRPVPTRSDGRFNKVLEWMRNHAAEPQTIDQLASEAAMSPRTFFRRFRETLGMTPYEWLTRERVMIAKDLLEESRLSLDAIAATCGFGTSTMLRHHFQRALGVNPSAYRNRFGETDGHRDALH